MEAEAGELFLREKTNWKYNDWLDLEIRSLDTESVFIRT